jgi:hypothetical protein
VKSDCKKQFSVMVLVLILIAVLAKKIAMKNLKRTRIYTSVPRAMVVMVSNGHLTYPRFLGYVKRTSPFGFDEALYRELFDTIQREGAHGCEGMRCQFMLELGDRDEQ